MPAPGEITTDWGFGFAQKAAGTSSSASVEPANSAVLSALRSVPVNSSGATTLGALQFKLRVDRGAGAEVLTVSLPRTNLGDFLVLDEAREALDNALIYAAFRTTALSSAANATRLASDFGLTVTLNNDRLQINLSADGTLNADGKVKAAALELIVDGKNTVAAIGPENFNNVNTIRLGDGAQTFVMGNDYWGSGGGLASAALQSNPYTTLIGRALLDGLTIDTSATVADGNALTLDFRAVNQELRFNFSPLANGKAKLTVTTIRDLTIPIMDLGPEYRTQKLVFTEVDANTIILGGNYKNTFNLENGATYEGRIIGGGAGGTGGAAGCE